MNYIIGPTLNFLHIVLCTILASWLYIEGHQWWEIEYNMLILGFEIEIGEGIHFYGNEKSLSSLSNL
jgi:hypothetical protein